MEREIQEFMAEYAVPGLSIAIAKDDELATVRSYGVADRETGSPVTERSRFRIASISKPITAVTVLRLAESGKLTLGDRVFGRDGVLGGDHRAGPRTPHLEEITIESLLAHTSGGWQNDENDPMFQEQQLDHSALIDWTLANRPLEHAPGEDYAYSNFGYCLLGRIIERATEERYDDAVRRLVLEPCGVTDMAIARNLRGERQVDEVVYYGQGEDDPYAPNVTRMDSHGGWIASAVDLVRFAIRVDGFPQKPDILTEDSVRRMSTGSTANPGYGLGWAVNEAGDWWHGGSLPGAATILKRTASGVCYAALTNTRRAGLGAEVDKLLWRVAGC
ncbi:MAG TPA: serine hydrolase domain-containing protein [Chthonomonadaceae bacterium]|nr:serine hydrolase domain-containing protein [Chthonomonadaceae bacterium]